MKKEITPLIWRFVVPIVFKSLGFYLIFIAEHFGLDVTCFLITWLTNSVSCLF